MVRMAEAYAFMVPAGGAVCCLATGCRCCCCCCGNCGPGSLPTPFPAVSGSPSSWRSSDWGTLRWDSGFAPQTG